MKAKAHFTLWVVLLLGGFLVGYVPKYMENRDLRAELQEPQKIIDALRLQAQLGQLRDAASLMILEVSRQNFGLARDHSVEYYTKLKELIDAGPDPALKKSLEELAATRDDIDKELANTTPGSLAASQSLLLKTIELTRSVK
jgi:hypothetical protein